MAQAETKSTYEPGRVGVVGLGLMGGSFAKAYAAAGHKTFAWNRSTDVLDLALIEDVDAPLDETTIPLCELIIVCLYPQACVEWLESNASLISPDAIVIDIAGVKNAVCDACWKVANNHDWHFCGAHPMAGTQYSGYAHARANLYHNAPMVLVPNPDADDVERLELCDRIEGLLEPCGFGRFSVTTPDDHDRLIAFTSQLAHVVSNAYVKSPTAQEHVGFSAGSYRDLTRVARLNATMWTELFLADAEHLSFEITTLIDELTKYRDAIDAGDAQTLCALLAEGDRLKREAESR